MWFLFWQLLKGKSVLSEWKLTALVKLCVGISWCVCLSPEPSTEKEYESLLMLAGLEKMMVQVMKEADLLKKGT